MAQYQSTMSSYSIWMLLLLSLAFFTKSGLANDDVDTPPPPQPTATHHTRWWPESYYSKSWPESPFVKRTHYKRLYFRRPRIQPLHPYEPYESGNPDSPPSFHDSPQAQPSERDLPKKRCSIYSDILNACDEDIQKSYGIRELYINDKCCKAIIIALSLPECTTRMYGTFILPFPRTVKTHCVNYQWPPIVLD